MEKKLTFEEFKETLQPYEIEGGFGKTIEKGFVVHYLPKDSKFLFMRFHHRNKKKSL
jgi:hypothetical protein